LLGEFRSDLYIREQEGHVPEGRFVIIIPCARVSKLHDQGETGIAEIQWFVSPRTLGHNNNKALALQGLSNWWL
jgi:hypothetical protein